jgi:hypothetical protein
MLSVDSSEPCANMPDSVGALTTNRLLVAPVASAVCADRILNRDSSPAFGASRTPLNGEGEPPRDCGLTEVSATSPRSSEIGQFYRGKPTSGRSVNGTAATARTTQTLRFSPTSSPKK